MAGGRGAQHGLGQEEVEGPAQQVQAEEGGQRFPTRWHSRPETQPPRSAMEPSPAQSQAWCPARPAPPSPGPAGGSLPSASAPSS